MQDADRDDDEVVLKRLNDAFLGKTVRQVTAPTGYEPNIGQTFLVGEVRCEGELAWARATADGWVPLAHLERVGTVTCSAASGSETCLVVSIPGRKCLRLELDQANMTSRELLGLFQQAVDYLQDADKADVSVSID